MTESEAIKEFNTMVGDRMKTKRGIHEKQHRLFQLAIDALEEIQQYREIGTVEEIKRMQKYYALAKKHSTIGKVIDSCAEYEDIGTVEECREAMERQNGKKPVLNENSNVMFCPVCERRVRRNYDLHCSGCGQLLDHSNIKLLELDQV